MGIVLRGNPESKTQGNRDKIAGTLTFSPEVYAANLEEIVKQLKQTGAVLVFATTTPVPEGEAGRKVGDDQIYNEAALAVMKRNNVLIDDLNAVMAGKMKEYAKGPGDVHFTDVGYALLGNAVAKAIESALNR